MCVVKIVVKICSKEMNNLAGVPPSVFSYQVCSNDSSKDSSNDSSNDSSTPITTIITTTLLASLLVSSPTRCVCVCSKDSSKDM